MTNFKNFSKMNTTNERNILDSVIICSISSELIFNDGRIHGEHLSLLLRDEWKSSSDRSLTQLNPNATLKQRARSSGKYRVDTCPVGFILSRIYCTVHTIYRGLSYANILNNVSLWCYVTLHRYYATVYTDTKGCVLVLKRHVRCIVKHCNPKPST